ncbi:MAG: DCC1-like thiol-disulfide oxidoreductase family protein [Pseudomonadota bacterium]
MTSSAEAGRPVILFDGVCNLCTGSVRFVIERDSRKQFRFASLQSPVADKLLGQQRNEADRLESVVLVVGERIYRKSSAALLIARRLDGLWPLLSVLLAIPRPVRDAVYDWIGRRRYRMFGKRDVCWTPQPELADRFLD